MSEWVSDTAALSAQYVTENHVLSNANDEWVTDRKSLNQRERESVWTWITFAKVSDSHSQTTYWGRESCSRCQSRSRSTCWGCESCSRCQSRSRLTCWERESCSRCHWIRVNGNHVYCAVKSLNMMLHVCWQHSATLSTVREQESRPQRQFSVCSRFANHERITAWTWITSSQFSVWVTAVPLPAGMLAAELNWTEKGTNQFMKWFHSLRSLKRFIRLNVTLATNTLLCGSFAEPSPCVFVDNRTALSENMRLKEAIMNQKPHVSLWY